VLYPEARGRRVSSFFFFGSRKSSDLLYLHDPTLLRPSFRRQSGAKEQEAGQPHLSSDPWIVCAPCSSAHGEALRLLRPLVGNHPDQVDMLFLYGISAITAAERMDPEDERCGTLLREATLALQIISVNNSSLTRVRLEFARALFLRGDDELSEEQFRLVLSGNPPELVAANILRFIRAIRERKRWSGYFGFSVAPDSNINSASDADVIEIFGLPFRLDEGSSQTSSLGVSIWGGGEYQHRLSGRARLWAGLDMSVIDYKGSPFDRISLQSHVDPRWLIDGATEASLLATAGKHWIAGSSDSNDIGTRLELRKRWGRRLSADGSLAVQQRRSRDDRGRRGALQSLRLGTAWLMSPTIRLDGQVGFSRDRPKAERLRNVQRDVGIGASFTLPQGWTLGANYRRIWTRHRGNWFPFTDGSPRRDRTRIVRASVLNRGFELFGFSPQLAAIRETRESNAQLHDYKRNRYELRAVRQF